MLEGTIKLHGEAGCGKTQLLQAVERTLREHPVLGDVPLRLVCRVQQPGSPEEVEVTFRRDAPKGKLQSNWSS